MKQAEAGKLRLFFMDASHFVHEPYQGGVWTRERKYIRSASGRERFNVLGAIDYSSKKVFTECNETTINSDTVCKLLIRMRKKHKGQKLVVVLDNASYQHCQQTINCAFLNNIELLFLPSYSPNLNLIERLWKFTKKIILENKYYDNFNKFTSAIETFLKDTSKKYLEQIQSLINGKIHLFRKEQFLT